MKTLIANKAVSYAGREYQQGEEFRVANDHVRVLVAAGFARETTPGPAVQPTGAKSPEPEKRSYRRRDMVAESPAASAPPVKRPSVMTTRDYPGLKSDD